MKEVTGKEKHSCHLFTNRQVLHQLLEITKQISQLVNYGHIDKTCFFFKLLLILPIHKLATKRDTLFVTNSSIKAKVPIHSPQVDQLVCTPNVTKSFKIDNIYNYSTLRFKYHCRRGSVIKDHSFGKPNIYIYMYIYIYI